MNSRSIFCWLHCRRVLSPVNLPGLSEMFARLESPSILGGNTAKAQAGRFSYWAAEPREIFEFQAGQKSPFGKLQKALNKYKLVRCFGNNNLPAGIFCGGWR